MKTLKKFLAFLLVLSTLFSLALPAMAEELEAEEEEREPVGIVGKTIQVPAALAAAKTGYSVAAAIPVKFGQTYTKYWDSENDGKDHYIVFTLPSDGYITISYDRPIDDEGEAQDLIYTVYNSAYEECFRADTTENNPVAPTLEMNVALAAGTYYLNTRGRFWYVVSGVIACDYSVSFTPASSYEKEPNEVPSTAMPMEFGQTYYAFAGATADEDYWKITLPAGLNTDCKVTVSESVFKHDSTYFYYSNNTGEEQVLTDRRFRMDSEGDYYTTIACTAGANYFWISAYDEQVRYSIRVDIDHDCSYDSGSITQKPTYSAPGVRTYTCSICGKTKTDTIPILNAAPAKPYKIANVVSGVHVYWNALSGAEKYGLWRSETGVNGQYKWIANPTVPHFTDTKVESGKTYYYKVSVLNTSNNTHTDKSPAIGVTYVYTPDITSRVNTAAGVKLGWEKIEGATGYAIYRKAYEDDAWTERIATIPGNETFTWTDESVKNNNGVAYKYTIRALAGSDMKTLSGCRNAGRTMVRLSSQVLKSAEKASATSVKCSWTTSSRVTGYEVRFLIDGEVFKTVTVGNYATGVKTFTGMKAGQTYTVQVRTYKKIDGVGSFYSDWSSAKTVKI